MAILATILTWAGSIILLILIFSGIRIVRPVERGLVETFGKFTKRAQPGFNYIIPVVQSMIRVNITENMADVSSQKIITKDDLNAEVDAVVYYRVEDPEKAIYEVDDYQEQIVSLSKTTLRNIIGKLTLSEANSKRGDINNQLEKELTRQIKGWGMIIVRVELQRIDPPGDVQKSMNEVVIAERTKIAATDLATARETEADGERRAEIKRAEGKKQYEILVAQGQANAIKEVAKANAERIKVVNESAKKYFKAEAQQLKALETAEKALKKGTKYVITDGKQSLVNVMSDIAGANIVPLNKKK